MFCFFFQFFLFCVCFLLFVFLKQKHFLCFFFDVFFVFFQVFFHFSPVFFLAYLFMFSCFVCTRFFSLKKKGFFTFGQADGASRSFATPTNQSFGVCKVNLATLKVAINQSSSIIINHQPSTIKHHQSTIVVIDHQSSIIDNQSSLVIDHQPSLINQPSSSSTINHQSSTITINQS